MRKVTAPYVTCSVYIKRRNFMEELNFFNRSEISEFFSKKENPILFYFNNNNPTFLWKYKSKILLKNEVDVFYGQTWLTLKTLCGARQRPQITWGFVESS